MNYKSLVDTVIKRNQEKTKVSADIVFKNESTGKTVSVSCDLIKEMEEKYGSKTLSMLNGLVTDELLDLV